VLETQEELDYLWHRINMGLTMSWYEYAQSYMSESSKYAGKGVMLWEALNELYPIRPSGRTGPADKKA